jgi:hypothetical protein
MGLPPHLKLHLKFGDACFQLRIPFERRVGEV